MSYEPYDPYAWHSLVTFDPPAEVIGPRARLADFCRRHPTVSPVDIIGCSRLRFISVLRQAFMAELYDSGRYSLPAIGRFLGGRDHTTILHGVRAHRARMTQ